MNIFLIIFIISYNSLFLFIFICFSFLNNGTTNTTAQVFLIILQHKVLTSEFKLLRFKVNLLIFEVSY